MARIWIIVLWLIPPVNAVLWYVPAPTIWDHVTREARFLHCSAMHDIRGCLGLGAQYEVQP